MSVSAVPRAQAAGDAACVAAVDLARAAILESGVAAGADAIGDHVGIEVDAQRVVTHLFAAELDGYRGWRWAVTVTRASRARQPTVDDVVLLPGPDALIAPQWVPWGERLLASDLGVGDLLPAEADDSRLVPAYVESTDPEIEAVALELGLGRLRVMSADGRDEVAERWYAGGTGPRTAMAAHAPARCGSCGFYLPLAGSMRVAFGVCGNEYAPADGRVVEVGFGCGAHSEAAIAPALYAAPGPAYDDGTLDLDAGSPPGAAAADEPDS
ncbi:MAG: DUF3027 domain-containing protein [Mycobacteriales bacterium]